MAYNDSKSRVQNHKQFDENWEEIFGKGKKSPIEPKKVEKNAKNELYGNATRYYYGKDE
jgi:hypothetical protein